MSFREKVDRLLGHSMRTFGETVTFYPSSGGVYKVQAVLDWKYEAIEPDTEQLSSANQPTLGVNLNDIKFEINQNDKVKVMETTFRVIDKREDGQGGTLLLLHKLKVADKTEDTRVR